MDQFWSALSAISTAVGAVIVLAAGLYARSQVSEARLSRNVTLLLEFQRQYHSWESRELRFRLFSGEFGDAETFDPKTLPPPDNHRLLMLFDQLDFLGLLVDRKLIDFDLVLSSFHLTPPRIWDIARPYILRRRSKGSPLLGIYFERLVQKYHDEYPAYVERVTKN
jgi:hypothetical protein